MKSISPIVQIVGSLGIGGAERVGAEIAKRVADAGYPSWIISATDHRSMREFREDLVSHGVVVKALSGPVFKKVRSIRQISSVVNPLILHVHTEYPEFLGMVWKILNPRIHLIRTIHNSVLWPNHPISRSVFRVGYRYLATSVSCSVRSPVPADETILNGIRWNMENDVEKRGYELAFVGRLESEKRPFDVLDIAKRVHDELPGLVFHVIGDGSLKNSLRDKYTEPWITWHGSVNNPGDILRKTRGILLASEFEGFPLVVLEGLDNLNYVIAPQDLLFGMDLPWIINYRRFGHDDAAKKLVNALLEFTTDELINLRELYSERYSVTNMIDHYIKLYSSITGECFE